YYQVEGSLMFASILAMLTGYFVEQFTTKAPNIENTPEERQ
ncbi:branched-chain amino acid ABC transporter permease, partial [Vibrio owensii]